MSYKKPDDDFFIKLAQGIVTAAVIVWITMQLTSCTVSDNLTKPDEQLAQGCKTKIAIYKLGAFNQQGGIETCKVKCSKDLPEGFTYKYDRNGCKVEVGTK